MFTKPKALPPISGINVIPMADTMVCLLVIFMVVTPMLEPGISLHLARLKEPIEYYDAKDDAVVVSVMRDGAVYLGEERVTESDAAKRIRYLMANRPERNVLIKCDVRARYSRVVAVVDAIRAAGVEQFCLVTERVRNRDRR